jgi:hypothetical protein
MTGWALFWTIFFFFSITIYAILVVVTTVGGFFNIRSLFKTLTKHHQAEENHDQQ